LRLVAPSIIAGDWGRLADCAQQVERAGADWLHLDVMDGHFVPNLTFGPDVVKAVRKVTKLPLDTHLMISEPGRYLERFALAGADLLSIHIEVCPDPSETLQAIRRLGVKAGLVLNPPTPFAAVEPYLSAIDLLLVMSVNPGFSGQSFIPTVLPKVEQAAAWRAQHDASFRIEMDGGIHSGTVKSAWNAGADVVVAGAAVMQKPDYAAAIRELKQP
jgi:ribulose-phosphate 3-epimerase